MPQFHDTLQYGVWRRRGDSNSQTPFQGSNGFQDRAVRQYCSDAKVLLSSESWTRTNNDRSRPVNSRVQCHSAHLGIKVLVPKIVRVEDYLCLGRRQIHNSADLALGSPDLPHPTKGRPTTSCYFAGTVGFEPTTPWLTARCTTAVLHANHSQTRLYATAQLHLWRVNCDS